MLTFQTVSHLFFAPILAVRTSDFKCFKNLLQSVVTNIINWQKATRTVVLKVVAATGTRNVPLNALINRNGERFETNSTIQHSK